MKIDHLNIEGLDYDFSVEVSEQDAVLVNRFKWNGKNHSEYNYAHTKVLPDVIPIIDPWSAENRWN